MGLVTPVGNDVASTWAALVAGQSGAGPITRFDSEKLQVHFACEVKGYDPLQYIDKKEARRYDLFSQFAMGAAVQAVRDACLEKSPLDPQRIGVIIGTGTGGIATFEENMRTFIEKGPSRVSPFFVPMFMANVASAIVSMRYGFQGPNYCTVSACASSGHALGDAFDLIRENKADVMVAGGSEAAITPLALASFANMKALSERNDDPKTASRPFDKDRDGFVMGDGAAVVILEEWERAKGRGAKIVAELVGYGATADAYHITAPPPHPPAPHQATRLALQPGDRRRVSHHRTGAGRLRRAASDAARDAVGRHPARGGRLHQRAWHVDPARRRGGDGGGEGRIRPAGEAADLRLDEVDDRPPARRRGGVRASDLRAGAAERRHPPDDQSVQSRSRLRS